MNMNKKIILLSALLCSLTQHASDMTSWFEIKPSYFFFATSPMNEIYDNGGLQLQGSASLPLCDYLDFYASVGYRQAWGNALNSQEDTSLIVIPVDIGLKPVFNLGESFHYFFAVGPRYFCFSQSNSSLYVNSIINDAGVGLFVNTGFNLEFVDCCVLGIFGEYSYENKIIDSNRPNVYSGGAVQMGGFAFGVSLGYAF
jgi:hypothetical protein